MQKYRGPHAVNGKAGTVAVLISSRLRGGSLGAGVGEAGLQIRTAVLQPCNARFCLSQLRLAGCQSRLQAAHVLRGSMPLCLQCVPCLFPFLHSQDL